VHIFGAPEAEDFAVGLGRMLQLVNILRDVDEDAAQDRVYVPLSRLGQDAAGQPAGEILGQPKLAAACAALAEQAAQGFETADRMLSGLDRRRLRPAILMMEAYRMLFRRLRARGWRDRPSRLRLTRADKLRLMWLALGPAASAPSGPRA
jgi:phytoene/squalene synthetase